MTKTLEELADEYAQTWWGPRHDYSSIATRQAFIAGYRAAMEKSTEITEIAWRQEQERLIDRLRSTENK
jgi:hypothetical protein